MPRHPKSGPAFYAKTSDLAWFSGFGKEDPAMIAIAGELGVSRDQAGFGAPARAFLAFHFASFFARLAAPAMSFLPLFLLRRVSSIWE